jgi:hypothetical protein
MISLFQAIVTTLNHSRYTVFETDALDESDQIMGDFIAHISKYSRQGGGAETTREFVCLFVQISYEHNRFGGHAVAQLVEALHYKPEGRGFVSRWGHRNFSTKSFRPHYGPEVDSASNRNEYQEYFLWGKDRRCVGLTTLPPSCANCREFWKPQPPGTIRACPGL